MTRISSSSLGTYVLPDPEQTQTQSPSGTTPNAHHRRHRHGVHGHGHHLAEQSVEEQSHHQQHLAQLAKRVRRPRTGKRSGAGSPEEPVTDSTFEELLLMLEEHAKKVEPLIIGVGQQDSQHDGEDDPGRDRRSTQGRQALLRRYLQETADEAAASKPAAAAAASTAAGEPVPDLAALDTASGDYKRLETELLAVRHAMLTGHVMPLRTAFKIMRAYLEEAPLANAPATLRAVRERLLATVAPRDAAAPPLSDREKAFNQLFPLMLLSASRPRTGRERAEGLARSGAVAKRWTADVWSYRAGLGLVHPPLPDSTM